MITTAREAYCQALRAKDQVPGCIVLMRLGDFYELFEEDAEVAAWLLDLTTTIRDGVKMAGLPYFALDKYLPRLTDAGYRVLVVEGEDA